MGERAQRFSSNEDSLRDGSASLAIERESEELVIENLGRLE